MPKTALIIVDVQNDFLPPSGALAVPNGDEIIPILTDLLSSHWDWNAVIVSQDYHPPRHISFASSHNAKELSMKRLKNGRGEEYEQNMWPDHCVVGTDGVEIEERVGEGLKRWGGEKRLVRKGWHPKIEAYSAFEGLLVDPMDPDAQLPADVPPKVSPRDTDLAKYLRERGVERVVVTGLATDYCVLSTARSSIEAGFETVILGAAVRGIDPDGVKRTFEELRGMGGVVLEEGGKEGWKEQLRQAMV